MSDGSVESNDDRNGLLEKTAREKDCEIVLPKDNELQLDLDSKQALREFRETWLICCDAPVFKNAKLTWWRSSGGNVHVVIALASKLPLTVEDRIRWQTRLGSDPVRDRVSLQRVEYGHDRPVALLRPRNAVVKDLVIRQQQVNIE